jgi:ribosomal peptide maturation radical SAM protein 1
MAIHSTLRVIDDLAPTVGPPPVPVSVALVNMPFSAPDRPSIQCGLLKAILLETGHPTEVLYLNMELAVEMGAKLYGDLARRREDLLLGDWLFAVAAFGPGATDDGEYFAACRGLTRTCADLEVDLDRLRELRHEVFPARIEQWAEEIDWSRYQVVGFSSVFEQNAAALALARAIKRRHPEIVTLFGGANFDSVMGKEFVRALPFIDYAVSGEADIALPRLLERIGQGQSPLGIPGVMGRSGETVVGPGEQVLIRDMDALPDPDYDDFFQTLFRLGRQQVLGSAPPLLLFQSARGCWWGERSQCTFCGLNHEGISYRSQSPARAAAQLRSLTARYKIVNLEAVDNIMDFRYLQEFCDALSEQRCDYRLFYEVKSNLNAAQLRTLRRAGVTAIQPGIESLSSHVLSLMHKGVTMLRNVRLLKWASYYDIRVGWNILTGFPGETRKDNEEQIRVIRLLRHLPPPKGTGRFRLERFSPYFFDRSFPLRDIRPLRLYRLVYPEDRINIEEIAYFFEYQLAEPLPEEIYQELRQAVLDWQDSWSRLPLPRLSYERLPDWIEIVDRRGAEAVSHCFEGPAAEMYEFCGTTDRSAAQVAEQLVRQGFTGLAAEDVREALEGFCDRGLMLRDGDRYLSIAQPVNPYW